MCTSPLIHESVFDRIDSGCNAYAPIGLPSKYVIVSRNGKLTSLGPSTYETNTGVPLRYAAQERLWNYVWLRRFAYFLTLAASLHLAAFWLFHNRNAEHEFDSYLRMVSETVRFIESFLPGSAHWWTDWSAANPEWFVGGIGALAIFTGNLILNMTSRSQPSSSPSARNANVSGCDASFSSA
jgi:hypothetical protein